MNINIKKCNVLLYSFFTLKKLILYQGNGHEADFDKDEQVFIMDVYNAYIYPRDMKVKSEFAKSSQVTPAINNKQLYLSQPPNYRHRGDHGYCPC